MTTQALHRLPRLAVNKQKNSCMTIGKPRNDEDSQRMKKLYSQGLRHCEAVNLKTLTYLVSGRSNLKTAV